MPESLLDWLLQIAAPCAVIVIVMKLAWRLHEERTRGMSDREKFNDWVERW